MRRQATGSVLSGQQIHASAAGVVSAETDWKDRAPVGTANLTILKRALGQEWVVAIGLVTLDIVAWIAIYAAVAYLRVDAFYTTPLQFLLVGLLQITVIVSSLVVIGGYSRHTDMMSLTYTTEHVLALAGAGLVSAFLIYSAATFDQSMRPSRGVLLLSFAAFLPTSLLYRRFVRGKLAASTANRTFLVVGSGAMAVQFYHAYTDSTMRQRLEFVGLEGEGVGLPIAGSDSPIVEGDLATKLSQVDRSYSGVILAERSERLPPELIEQLVRTQFLHTRVYTLESFHEAHWRCVPVETLDPSWPLRMGFQLARNSPYHYFKRLFDLVVVTILMVLTAPIFGVIVALIWLRNGPPAIFRQVRVTRNNHPFTVLKFRTMYARADEEAGEIYTRRNDPRITGVGKWLRKLRLDELPQLWNVFTGEMSLIGPRAEWIKCAERYEKIIPFYHFRHLVKPGITGWAQVNYPYGESDEDAIEKLKYDLYYIRNYSLKLDLMIVLKTVHTVLFGKGQ